MNEPPSLLEQYRQECCHEGSSESCLCLLQSFDALRVLTKEMDDYTLLQRFDRCRAIFSNKVSSMRVKDVNLYRRKRRAGRQMNFVTQTAEKIQELHDNYPYIKAISALREYIWEAIHRCHWKDVPWKLKTLISFFTLLFVRSLKAESHTLIDDLPSLATFTQELIAIADKGESLSSAC
jgi:hypothetical protein